MEKGFAAANVTGRTILQMEGPESLDLLQRISTNDLSNAPSGACRDTVLTTEKGRIIDVVSVYVAFTDRLLLVGQSRSPGEIRNWIEKFIIMEDVRVTDATQRYDHLVFLPTPKESTEQNEIKSLKANLLHRINKPNIQGMVFEQTWDGIVMTHVLLEKGAVLTQEINLVPAETFEALRIQLGIPSNPQELNPAYNPLEANLQSKVSFTKGCYVGQEVIARLDTYKKLQRKLVKLEIPARVNNAPYQIYSGREEVGLMTSVAPVGNSLSTGLGYVRLQWIEQSLQMKSEGREIPLKLLL
ncbi:MAG: hypothetical protein WBD36_10970 [Bacteroidota bacterium]